MITFLANGKISDQEVLKEQEICYPKTVFKRIGVTQDRIQGVLECDDEVFDVDLSLFNNRLSGSCSCGNSGLCVHEAMLYKKYSSLVITSLPYFYDSESEGCGLYLTLSKDRSLLLRYDGGSGLVDQMVSKMARDYDGTYKVIEGDDIPAFLEKIDDIRKETSVYIDDSIKKKNYEKADFKIKAGLRNDLLQISFDSENINKDELKDVLKSYREKKAFHVLKDGKVLLLDDKKLKEVDETVKELGISDLSGTTEVDRNRIFALESKELEIDRNEEYAKLLEEVSEQHFDDIPVVEKYDGILRDYQCFGYRWLKAIDNYGFGGILADDMGLGKTLEMMAYLESLKGEGVSIVVAPASLVYNWADELKKFNSDLRYLCVTGTNERRKELISGCQDYDLVITSYDYIRRDTELYQDITFRNIVLDEAQYIKNHSTINAKSVKSLKAVRRFAMSGTPIENSLSELWSVFDFIMPGYLSNYNSFYENYEKDILNKNKNVSEKLHKMVAPFILRRKKTEVLKELPEKIGVTHLIDFSEDEMKLYQANALNAVNELEEEKKDKIYILAEMTKLRRICQDRRLVYDNIEGISSKMEFCLELVDKIIASEEKVLIFSSFTSLLDLLGQELDKREISYMTLTGDNSKEQRKQMVDRFQKEGDVSVFLLSLKAAGTGLNLTAANNVIHFDPWWNMSATSQASDRTYRMGQKKGVVVHYLIMKDTIEEKIQLLQQNKQELADAFIEGNAGTISSMTKDQLLELFR